MTLGSPMLMRLAGYDAARARRLAEASRDADRERLEQELADDERRFRESMERVEHEPHLVIGRSADDVPYRVSLADLTSLPVQVTGGTGSGKSRLVGGYMARIIARIARGQPGAVIELDGKGETADQTLRSLAAVAEGFGPRERESFLSGVYVFDFDGDTFLPSWPVVARDPALPIEVQADVIAETLAEVVADATTGPRQRDDLAGVEALAIELGIPLPAQPWLLGNPFQVEELAHRSSIPLVQLRLGRFSHENRSSVDGLVARLNVLLRSPTVRAALSGPHAFDFRACFKPGAITVVRLPRKESRSVMRAVGSLITSAIADAALDPRRRVECATSIVLEEPQTFMTSVSMRRIDELLTQGRWTRAAGLTFVHQGAHQLPAELQESLDTNLVLRAIGRSSARDAEAAAEWLPRTGRVPRSREPGVRRSGESRFLSEGEERRFRIAQVGRLPVRNFVIADRRVTFQPRVIRAEDYEPPEWSDIDPEVVEAVRRGANGYPRTELEARARRIEEEAALRLAEAERQYPADARRKRRVVQTPDVVGRGSGGSGEVP